MTRWSRAVLAGFAIVIAGAPTGQAAQVPRLDGFNIIVAPAHPFGSAGARRAIEQARHVGAGALAIIPFLWQASPASGEIGRGKDMPDEELRAAIRDVRARGLRAVIKPHVWVPGSWAGAVAPANDNDWRAWFAGYQSAIVQLARVAAEGKADAFVIGTELKLTVMRPEWRTIIRAVRAVYSGPLLYVAHNVEGAERVPFWGELDAVGVSLYPPLGGDDDRSGRQAVIAQVASRLDALAARYNKPVIVGEVGLRSAAGAAAMPWESPEERAAEPDPLLQADVLDAWLQALERPSVRGVLIWRWLTDPAGGGVGDTDFTVQGKPAELSLRCAWTGVCVKAGVEPDQKR